MKGSSCPRRCFCYGEFTTLRLPATVEEIEGGFLAECNALQELELAEGNDHFVLRDGCLYTADGKILVWANRRQIGAQFAIPEGVEVVAAYAFTCCEMEEVTFPSTLKRIEKCAFQHCEKLSLIRLPEGVESLGYYAFRDCSALASIHLPASLKNFGGREVFDGCASRTLYAPAGAYAKVYAEKSDMDFVEE